MFIALKIEKQLNSLVIIRIILFLFIFTDSLKLLFLGEDEGTYGSQTPDDDEEEDIFKTQVNIAATIRRVIGILSCK